MTTTSARTAEQLHALPGHGERYEILDGEPREKPVRNPEHGAVSARLATAIGTHALERKAGEVLIETRFRIRREPERSRIPGVAFVRAERWERVDRRAPAFEGAPDLAIEVVSPSDSYGEVRDKASKWLEAGARLVWVVQPMSRTVEVYRPEQESVTLTVEDTLSGGDVLPGFSVPLRSLFDYSAARKG